MASGAEAPEPAACEPSSCQAERRAEASPTNSLPGETTLEFVSESHTAFYTKLLRVFVTILLKFRFSSSGM